MHSISNRATTVFMALAALIASAGCGPAEDAEAEDLGQVEQAAGYCIMANSRPHCTLGNTQLTTSPTPTGTTQVNVSGMNTVGADGVLISLPQATQWSSDGAVGTPRTGALHYRARAIASNIATSAASIDESNGQFTFTAGFTGTGQGSTYSVIIYNGTTPVAAATRIQSGKPAATVVRRSSSSGWWWPLFWFLIRDMPANIMAGNGTNVAVNPGACVWQERFAPGLLADFRLPDGRVYTGDRIDIIEEVPVTGSYPYLTFDTMEYTSNGGSLSLLNEIVRTRT